MHRQQVGVFHQFTEQQLAAKIATILGDAGCRAMAMAIEKALQLP